MAYKLMKILINNYKSGVKTYSKERMLVMVDTYYAAGRLTDDEYLALVAEINELE